MFLPVAAVQMYFHLIFCSTQLNELLYYYFYLKKISLRVAFCSPLKGNWPIRLTKSWPEKKIKKSPCKAGSSLTFRQRGLPKNNNYWKALRSKHPLLPPLAANSIFLYQKLTLQLILKLE